MPEELRERVYPLNGGMVSAGGPHTIPRNACWYLKNYRVWQGDLRTAKGYTPVTTAAVTAGTTAIRGLFAGARSDGSVDVIVAANAEAWRLDGTVWDSIGAFTGMDPRFGAACFMDRWVFANGGGEMREWDGTTLLNLGMDAPAAITASAYAASGDIGKSVPSGQAGMGIHTKIAWKDDRGFLSNPYPAADYQAPPYVYVASTSTSGSVLVTWASANAPTQATHVVVYAATGGGGKLPTYYFCGSAALSASEYVIATVSGRSATDTVGTDFIRPASGMEQVIVHQDRLLAVNDDKVYISGLSPVDIHTLFAGRYEPVYWPRNFRVAQGESHGQLTLFVIRHQAFLVTPSRVVRIWTDSGDPDVWEFATHLPNVGIESRRSLACVGDVAFWLGRVAGRLTIVAFDGGRFEDVGAPMYGRLAMLDTGAVSAAVAGAGHGFYWLTVKLADGTWETWELNTNRGDGVATWATRDWQAQAYATIGGSAYAVMADAKLYLLESGLSAGSANQSYELQTAAFDLGSPEHPKQWKAIQLEVEAITGAAVASGYYKKDQGSWTPTAAYVVSAAQGTVNLVRHAIVTDSGRRLQHKIAAVASASDHIVRGLAMKGVVEPWDTT